jgi:DNA-binding CsgD family transcriptional regulator
MIAGSPTPRLPRGAGGPLRRAAGRVSVEASALPAAGRSDVQPAAALVLEPDPLARLLVVPAATALGFRVAEGASACSAGLAPSAVFVPLERTDDCRRACAEVRRRLPGPQAPLVVGYGAGGTGLLSAHRVHRCADVVLRLTASAGRPCFAHLPAADAVAAAGLTVREADVLVLLLRGLTTAAVGARLCVSPSTARTHCRAVLRKLGAGDRRALRALLLAGEVCPAAPANLAEESGVAVPRHRAHT